MMNLNKDTEIIFYGERITIEQFNTKYLGAQPDMDEAIGAVEVLITKGKAMLVEGAFKTPQQKMFEQVQLEETVRGLANMADMEEESQKDYKAQKKREGKLVHNKVEIDFPSYTKAIEALNYCRDKVRLKEVTINSNGGAINTLVLLNVTENELSSIKKYYNVGKVTDFAVGAITKAQEDLTEGLDYASKNILTPVAKITARSGMSIARSIFALGAKTTANVITATSQGVKQTRDDLVTDPDILRATREIIGVKDAFSRKLNSNQIGGAGIRIVE